MGKSCAALGCSNGIAGSKLEDSNISFHKFPLRHPDLLAVWTTRTGRRLGAFTPTEHSRLCSRHFLRRDFINPDAPKARRLRDDTIPSINLPGFPITDNYVGKECKQELSVALGSEMDCSKTLPAPMPTCKAALPMPLMGPITPTLPPSQLRKLAHKQQLGEGVEAQMDPVLRETWEVLATEPDFSHSANGADTDSAMEDKIVRVKPQLWPQVIQQHHHHPPLSVHQTAGHTHNHHHHHHHHQHHHPAHAQSQSSEPIEQSEGQASTNEHRQSQAEDQSEQSLTEEQEQQLEHEERNFRSASSSIATESFSHQDPNRIKLEMNEMAASHDDYQPPAKKPYQPHVECSLGVSTDVSSDHAVPMTHFDCGTTASPVPTTGHIHHPHFDLTGTQHRMLNGGVMPSISSAFHVQNDLHIPRPTHREKSTSPWDSLWSEVGKAIRTVADSFAHYLRTKADIALEQHQCEMEDKGFRPRAATKVATKTTNTPVDEEKEVLIVEESNGHVDDDVAQSKDTD